MPGNHVVWKLVKGKTKVKNFKFFSSNFGPPNRGGDETRSGYVRYIQGNQPNVPARTTCRHGLYNSMVCART